MSGPTTTTTTHTLFSHHTAFSPSSRPLTALAVSPDLNLLYVGSLDGVLRVFSFSTLDISNPTPITQLVPSQSITSLAVHSTGLVLVTTSDVQLRVFDRSCSTTPLLQTAAGDRLLRLRERTHGHVASVTSAIWDADRSPETHGTSTDLKIISGSEDGTVRVWHTESGKKVGMDQHLASSTAWRVLDVRGLPNNSLIVTAVLDLSAGPASKEAGTANKGVVAGDNEGGLHWFSMGRAKACKVLRNVHDGPVEALVQIDHRWVSKGANKVVIWKDDQIDGQVEVVEGGEGDQGVMCAVDHGGRKGVAIGQRKSISIVDIDKQQVVERMEIKKGVCRSIVSRKGQLFVGTSEGAVECWWGGDSGGIGQAVVGEKRRVAAGGKSGKKGGVRGEVYSYEELLKTGEWKETRTGVLRQVEDADVQARVQRLKQMERPDSAEIGVEIDARKRKGAEILEEETEYCPKCGLKLCVCGYMKNKRSRQ